MSHSTYSFNLQLHNTKVSQTFATKRFTPFCKKFSSIGCPYYFVNRGHFIAIMTSESHIKDLEGFV